MKLELTRRLFGAGLLTLLTTLATPSLGHAGVLHGPVFNPANGHAYYLLTQSDWTSAQLEAVSLGGNLATVRNAAENQWIYNTFSTFGGASRGLWIGLDDQATEGTFVWSSGEAFAFTQWASAQPDNHINLEHYVHLFPPGWAGAGLWNDYQDLVAFGTNPLNGVVEIIPPCGSLVVNYCTAGTSASDCQATLSSSGVASASAASGFDLHASSVEGARDGMFFFASNGRQANAWGNGSSFMCVVPPVHRGGRLAGSGTSGQCDGSFSLDLNARFQSKPHQNPGAGAICQAQLWYLDPLNTSNRGSSLSDALEFCVAP